MSENAERNKSMARESMDPKRGIASPLILKTPEKQIVKTNKRASSARATVNREP
jgi:hypothetical protein